MEDVIGGSGRTGTATILLNPAARRAERFDADGAVRFLRRRGFDPRLVTPDSAAAMVARAGQAAARGDALLFVVGGDGALGLAAAGLAGTGTALAAVPAGTANVWAQEMGIPRGIRAAFEGHLTGQVADADLGYAGDTPFLLMAGIGWDAAIAGRVSLALKRRAGPLAYLVQAARMLPALRPHQVRWWAEQPGGGREQFERPLAAMLLGNTRLYGGMVKIADRASAADGHLDLYALCPEGRGDGLRLVLKTLRHWLEGDARAVVRRTRAVGIETPGLHVQVDGDVIGETPMTFTVQPGALRVSVPGGVLPPVLRPPARAGE
ncbi:MAG: diacylglycerol/lipid kinase family protein [Tepidiformaceae bacterium]